jgi:hypothetical protein
LPGKFPGPAKFRVWECCLTDWRSRDGAVDFWEHQGFQWNSQ